MSQITYTPALADLSDKAVIKRVGEALKRLRVDKNISQHQLSELTGLNRVTIVRLESGSGANLITVIQILRALGELELLSQLFKEPEISPILMLKVQEKQRQRAYSSRKSGKETAPESEW